MATHSKHVPSHLLELFRIGLNPTLRAKRMSIFPKYYLILMKHPCIDTDDCALRKVDSRYRFSASRDVALEDETNGRVDAKSFVDDCGANWCAVSAVADGLSQVMFWRTYRYGRLAACA